MERWKRALPLMLLAGALTFAGAACGGDDDDDTDGTTTVTATSDAGDAPSQTAEGGATTSPEATPGEAGDTLIQVQDIGEHGAVLTDSEGMVLYIFTNDEEGVSNCNGNCATNWPPLLYTGPNAPEVEGAPNEFSLITREDGSMQVAYDGQPLYTYAADPGPGQATGEGVGGVWFVAKADPD